MALQVALRPIQRDRIRMCCYALRSGAENIPVVITDEGRARVCNLQHCGSIWECPHCALAIKARRAEEVTKVIETHGRERCVMLTLTVAHGWADSLEKLRQDIADAWSGFIRGRPWLRVQAELGVEGFIRALEVTHGKNGWHPHLHIVLLLSAAPAREAVAETEDGGAEWNPPIRARILARWQTMVERYCGAQHVPDAVHGVSLSPVHRTSYLSKLGLELTDLGTKRGKNGSRTPFQIGWDYKLTRTKRDKKLWQGYCGAMRGAMQLTWSRGLKRRFGIRDRLDVELVEDPGPGDRIIGRIPIVAWKQIRVLEVYDEGRTKPALCFVLEQAEAGGPRGFERACLHVLCGSGRELPAATEGKDRAAYEKWVAELLRKRAPAHCGQVV